MVSTSDQIESCGCQVVADDARRFCVNTEGTEHSWPRSTITSEEIARLGGWDPGQGVIEVHEDNSERTLQPGEVVHLRSGHAFCRRVRWKRGFIRAERLDAEIAHLREAYPGVERRDNWVRIAGMPLPVGWNRTDTDVAFLIPDAFPGAPPSGLFVPTGLRFNGNTPQSYSEPAAAQLPFGGSWGLFSWTIHDAGDWRPSASVEKGVNLLQWVRGFNQRFSEGA